MSIQEHLNKIRNAIYGREVRESIAKGIETAYDDASEKDNANMEVKIARGAHPNLRSRLEEVDNKQQQTTTQLAQTGEEITRLEDQKADLSFVNNRKRDNTVKIEPEDVSEDFLSLVTGQGTIDLKSVPQDNSVTPRTTTFVEGVNMFNGLYSNRWVSTDLVKSENTDRRTAILEIENQKKYFIESKGIHDRFNIYLANNIATDEPAKTLQIKTNTSGAEQFEFTNDENYKFVLITVSINNQEPLLSVTDNIELVLGDEAIVRKKVDEIKTEYIKDKAVTKEKVDFIDGLNLFDDVYESVYVENGLIRNSVSGDSKSAFIKMENGKTYKLKTIGHHNRFRVYGVNDKAILTPAETIIIRGTTNGNETLTFVNDNNYEFLLIQLTSENILPELIVKEGELAIDGVSIATNEEDGINGEFLKRGSVSKDKLDFEVEPSSSGVYKTTISNDYPYPLHTDVYDRYDELLSLYPHFVSKNILGVDGLGNSINEYVFKTPDYNSYPEAPRNQEEPILKPKVLIATGIHGYERSPVIGLYKFFKDLCENKKLTLSILRESVEFRILPTCVPSSYDQNTRWNHNNVNINRNFSFGWVFSDSNPQDYSGDSAASELETQIMEEWYSEHSDAICYLDWHNTAYTDLEVSSILTGSNVVEKEMIRKSYLKTINKLSQHWRNDYGLPENRNLGYTAFSIAKGASKEQASFEGIPAFAIEFSWQQKYTTDTGRFGPVTNAMTTELAGNLLLSLCKEHIE